MFSASARELPKYITLLNLGLFLVGMLLGGGGRFLGVNFCIFEEDGVFSRG